jgi:hypothetical protein
MGAVLFFHPTDLSKIFVAPGKSKQGDHSADNLRVGVGYDFVIGHTMVVGPTVAVDMAEHSTPHWVYGVSLGYGF